MRARLRSWWQKTSKPLDAVIVTVLVVLLALLVVIILGYRFNWSWTGLHGRTLYDWLQLLIIPAVLAVGGYLFNYTTSRNEQAVASDNQREAAMKEYFDKMSELMLHENLSKSDSDAEVRKIARVWTLTVLPRLDKKRKRSVLLFLYESGLINKGKSIVDLNGADLSGAFLSGANLSEADLSGADLIRANLGGADLARTNLHAANLGEAFLFDANLQEANLSPSSLFRAILQGTNLRDANLYGAILQEADLSESDLRGAIGITNEKLEEKAKSLRDATMPDGTIHA